MVVDMIAVYISCWLVANTPLHRVIQVEVRAASGNREFISSSECWFFPFTDGRSGRLESSGE